MKDNESRPGAPRRGVAAATKAGALYFVGMFALGWVLGPIRELVVVPRTGPAGAVALEGPVMVVAAYFWARHLIARFSVPAGTTHRAAMGLTGLALLLSAELLMTRLMLGLDPAQFLVRLSTPRGLISMALFASFAAMPMLLLVTRTNSQSR